MMRRTLLAVLAAIIAVIHGVGGQAEDSPTNPDSVQPLSIDVMGRRLSSMEELIGKQTEQLQEQSQQLEAVRSANWNLFLGSVVPAEQFMPPPADPGNLFFKETDQPTVNLGAGSRVAGTDLIFRAALTGNVLMWYDTGLVGSGSQFDPSQIASGGSAAQGAGGFDMVNFDGQLKFDLNVPISPSEQAQAYLETNYLDGEMRIRHAFGRADFSRVNVLAGSYWTTWGDEGTIPKSINSLNGFPAGANTVASVPQLRFAFPTDSGWVTSIAIQQPQPMGNIQLAANDVVLQRYPDLAARIRYFDSDFFSVSIGGIFHTLGRESVSGTENFAPGWGLSAATRFRTSECGALMAGAVGGKGIAGSIFGLSDTLAAGTSSGGNLTALPNCGGYAGYQHQWSQELLSTLAYGIAQGNDTAVGTTTRSQNVWANMIYQANDNFAFAIQYEYGDRAIVDRAGGMDHRVSLVVSVTTGQNNKLKGAIAGALSQGAFTQGMTPQSALPQSTNSGGSGISRFRRL